MKETVLWTNPNPTSSQAVTDLTLGESILNYDFLKITWRHTTSDPTSKSVYVSTLEFLGNSDLACSLEVHVSAGEYSRPVYHQVAWADNILRIGGARRVATSGADATVGIVTSIIGIKV